MSGTKPSTACNIIIIVTLIQVHWQGASSVNVLESIPLTVNGVLTVCAGQQISLTCNHDNVGTASTRWIASPPVTCITDISHIHLLLLLVGHSHFKELLHYLLSPLS